MLTVKQLRAVMDGLPEGAYVVVQRPGGADLDDCRAVIATDNDQTGEEVLVLIPE